MSTARGAWWALLSLMLLAGAPPEARAGEPPPSSAPTAEPEPSPAATPTPSVEPEPAAEPPLGPSPAPPTAAQPAPAPTAEPAPPQTPFEKTRVAVAEGRFGAAVVLCDEARRDAGGGVELPLEARAVCARAYVGLGDKLYAVGSRDAARQRWEQGAALDPRLLDDPAFTERLARTETAPTPTTPPPPAPPRSTEPEPEPARPADAGPRWDRGLGAGLSFGFDGVGAVMISWMTDGTIAVDFSVGVVFPVFDVRVRWFGLQKPLTPVLGLGMTIPFGDLNRLGGGLGSFHSLYELGESMHVDIGASWAVTEHLDLFAGVAFVTPVDQSNPDTVIFFPQLATQIVWYF